jgi:transcription initiation protein SPT3
MSDKGKYRSEIHQMMFVSGETGEADQETTSLIEEIVRQQVLEMVCNPISPLTTLLTNRQLTKCTSQAARRGSRAISTDDLIFLIRHDSAKVARLRTFLSWKDVRKNVKDSEDKGSGDAVDLEDPAGALGGAGPVDPGAKKSKKTKVGLPWDVASFYSEQVPDRDDEEDDEEADNHYATLERLKLADERTKDMTKEEYVHFSECRQASFTFRKGKRFREWAGFGVVTDSKPNDDIVDILGFLTFEIVQTLTEEALRIKAAEDLSKKNTGEENQTRKRKRERGLFDPPEEGRTPVGMNHVQEAFRRLQHRNNKSRAMRNFTSGLNRTSLNLVSPGCSLHLESNAD